MYDFILLDIVKGFPLPKASRHVRNVQNKPLNQAEPQKIHNQGGEKSSGLYLV